MMGSYSDPVNIPYYLPPAIALSSVEDNYQYCSCWISLCPQWHRSSHWGGERVYLPKLIQSYWVSLNRLESEEGNLQQTTVGRDSLIISLETPEGNSWAICSSIFRYCKHQKISTSSLSWTNCLEYTPIRELLWKSVNWLVFITIIW